MQTRRQSSLLVRSSFGDSVSDGAVRRRFKSSILRLVQDQHLHPGHAAAAPCRKFEELTKVSPWATAFQRAQNLVSRIFFEDVCLHLKSIAALNMSSSLYIVRKKSRRQAVAVLKRCAPFPDRSSGGMSISTTATVGCNSVTRRNASSPSAGFADDSKVGILLDNLPQGRGGTRGWSSTINNSIFAFQFEKARTGISMF